MKHSIQLIIMAILLLGIMPKTQAEEYWQNPVWGSQPLQVRAQESGECTFNTINANAGTQLAVLSYYRAFWGHNGQISYYFLNDRLYRIKLEIPELDLTPADASVFLLKIARPQLKNGLKKPEELLVKGSKYVPSPGGFGVFRDGGISFASSGLWYNDATLIYLDMDTYTKPHLSVELLDLTNTQNHIRADAIIKKTENDGRVNGRYGHQWWWWGIAGFLVFIGLFILIVVLGTKSGMNFNSKLPRWGGLHIKAPYYKK